MRNPQFFQNCYDFRWYISWLCFDFSWCYIEIDHNFERTEGLFSKNERTLDNTICTGHDTLLFFLLCCTKITISKEERNALNMKQIHNVIHEEKWENKMLIMNWIIDLVITTMPRIYTFCPKIILPLISIKIWSKTYFFSISKNSKGAVHSFI